MHPLLIVLGIVAACSPSLAWDDDDDFSGSGFKNKSTQSNFGYKSHQSEDTSFAAQQRKSLKVDSIHETQEKQNRWHEEFTARSKQMYEDQNKKWDKLQARQEAENNAWEARQWKDVETVAGAFVASGPYYKAGQRCVNTDKGLVYSTGNGCVVAPDGFYYRSGKLWVGPNGKLAGQSGSGHNRYIWGNEGDSAISAGGGYFTDRGYSWPAYPNPVAVKPTWLSR